jgi:hypothetical protein
MTAIQRYAAIFPVTFFPLPVQVFIPLLFFGRNRSSGV